jgi:hypothetical protein
VHRVDVARCDVPSDELRVIDRPATRCEHGMVASTYIRFFTIADPGVPLWIRFFAITTATGLCSLRGGQAAEPPALSQRVFPPLSSLARVHR